MKKKGAGKKRLGVTARIFIVIGILFLIFVIIAGITFYQGHSFFKAFQEESAKLQELSSYLENKDCSKLPDLELSVNKITQKARNACANPIIWIVIQNLKQNNEKISVSCEDINTLSEKYKGDFDNLKNQCAIS